MATLSFKGAREIEGLNGHVSRPHIGVLLAMKKGGIDAWKIVGMVNCKALNFYSMVEE